VQRVDANTVTDLSGRWNDTDIRTVCKNLVAGCEDSPRIKAFILKYATAHDGKTPAVLVGRFSNDSSEHIDTSIIAKNMETAIFNSGTLNFVAGGPALDQLRAERDDQQTNASEDTAARLANETGAALLLTGSVKSSTDADAGTMTRSYFVYAQMVNVETREVLWMATDDSIKKIISRSKYRP
jgi:hypothetical protein